MTNTQYQQCSKTVMDNIADPYITFDKDGICNYYHEYYIKEKKHVKKGQEGIDFYNKKIDEIKKSGKNNKYDCILGLSGGVDSSYLAYLAKKDGLNPLVVHFDNGWNSELAVKNIESIVSNLGFDLYTYVINWEEFKDIQLAYIKASVIDIEAITDHAIIATLYKLAAKHKIKYFLSGFNIVTEGILPKAWVFNKQDAENIKSIHKTYGTIPLKTFPFLDAFKKRYYSVALNIESVPLLNYISYNKADVKQILINELNWKDYGGKHYESVFTRFYQGFILPEKFKVDKRKAHLSTLICSGQISKEKAVQELKEPICDAEQLSIDKDYVLKKLGFNDQEFDAIMKMPTRSHLEFKTESKSYFDKYPIIKPLKGLYNLIKSKR
ncbi:MAG: N-acetyl sugar amidotransferase [Flavobacteriales bacterium]|nr:N-acetyl sugar amidotransferase [Flavobacteriales bacterium]MCB9365436.1 N-acetyl sugar amidotransferase [Flavobacteriales bacterium]